MVDSAEEKRRKRLEAWRKRQAGKKASGNANVKKVIKPKRKKPTISLSLSASSLSKRRKIGKALSGRNKLFLESKKSKTNLLDDSEDDDESVGGKKKDENKVDDLDTLMSQLENKSASTGKLRGASTTSRWDVGDTLSKSRSSSLEMEKEKGSDSETTPVPASVVNDALDQFMEKLDTSALGDIVTKQDGSSYSMTINTSGTMQKELPSKKNKIPHIQKKNNIPTISADELAHLYKLPSKDQQNSILSNKQLNEANGDGDKPIFTTSDWESDANTSTMNDTEASEVRSNFVFFFLNSFFFIFFICLRTNIIFHYCFSIKFIIKHERMRMKSNKNLSLKLSKIYQLPRLTKI